MLRSDYIRRLMEQLSRVLARSRELERDGRLAEARAEFERAAALTRNERERRLLLDRAASCAAEPTKA
jgi:predicted RNA polymerase sigma factor